MAALDARHEAGLPRMTKIAIVDRPRRSSIVTGAAITSIDKVLHTDSRLTRLHPDSKFYVADRTLKPNPVKPVRKYDRRNSLRLGVII